MKKKQGITQKSRPHKKLLLSSSLLLSLSWLTAPCIIMPVGSTRGRPSPGKDSKPLYITESSGTMTVESGYFITNNIVCSGTTLSAMK